MVYKLNTIGCSYVASGSIAQVNTKDGSESLSGIMTCTHRCRKGGGAEGAKAPPNFETGGAEPPQLYARWKISGCQ